MYLGFFYYTINLGFFSLFSSSLCWAVVIEVGGTRTLLFWDRCVFVCLSLFGPNYFTKIVPDIMITLFFASFPFLLTGCHVLVYHISFNDQNIISVTACRRSLVNPKLNSRTFLAEWTKYQIRIILSLVLRQAAPSSSFSSLISFD